jgi:hypothetical protein
MSRRGRLARLEGRLPRETCEAFLRAVAGPGAGERCLADGDEAATLAWLGAVLAEIRREKGDG